MRLLDARGIELIRYDLKENDTALKADTLQDKSSRYYYQEAKHLSPHEVYISKLDLNEEIGKIEEPHKKTIRIVQKIMLADQTFYIAVNYDLSTLLRTALTTTLYELFFIEEKGEINMHLDDTYAFSLQQEKNIYFDDFIETEEEFISKKRLHSIPYELVISIKKSKIKTLNGMLKTTKRQEYRH